MFWYETQFRHAEEARQRNKREDRKLKLEIEKKNGMKSLLKTQVDAVSKEQRRIKRELDKIRKSSFGPTNVFNATPRRTREHFRMPLYGKKSPKRKISRDENTLNFITNELQRPEKEKENDLMRSIMYVDCETSSKDNNEFFNKEMKSRFNDLYSDTTSSIEQQTVFSFGSTDIINNTTITEQSDDLFEIDLQGLSTVDNSQPVVSPHWTCTPTRSQISACNSEFEFVEDSDVLTELKSAHHLDVDKASEGQSKYRTKSLDLSQLANLDMRSVKSNVTRRLSGTNAPSQSELARRRASDGTVAFSRGSRLPPAPRRGSEAVATSVKRPTPSPVKSDKTKDEFDANSVNLATPDSREVSSKSSKHPKELPPRLDYDPEYFNADGSLKGKWNLPDPDKAWEQARNARYVRTSIPRECERELDVSEIFK